MSTSTSTPTDYPTLPVHKCIVCNENAVNNSRVTLNNNMRKIRGINKPISCRKVLENLLSKIYDFDCDKNPIGQGLYMCKRCYNKLSILYSTFEVFNSKLKPGSYLFRKIGKGRADKPKVPTAAPPAIKTPLYKTLTIATKTQKGSRIFKNFVGTTIRSECKSLIKNTKIFNSSLEIENEIQLENMDLFWNSVESKLDTYAPLTKVVLEGIAIQKYKYRNEDVRLIPAIGTAFCILLNKRSQKCLRFQKLVSYVLSEENSRKQIYEFLNPLCITTAYHNRIRTKKKESSASLTPAHNRNQMDTNIFLEYDDIDEDEEKRVLRNKDSSKSEDYCVVLS